MKLLYKRMAIEELQLVEQHFTQWMNAANQQTEEYHKIETVSALRSAAYCMDNLLHDVPKQGKEHYYQLIEVFLHYYNQIHAHWDDNWRLVNREHLQWIVNQ